MTGLIDGLMARWRAEIDASNLSPAGIERAFGLPARQLHGWLDGRRSPNTKSRERVEEVLMRLKDTTRIPYHPSFGYATAEQIERLKQSIPQHERAAIMKQIEKQTKLRGKVD